METLTESSIAPELRGDSLIPTSPDDERTHRHHHNNNNVEDDVLRNIIHPSNMLEEQSQSSQDSRDLVSPPPGVGAIPDETVENIAKELQNSCSDNNYNDTTDSQPEPDAVENTDSSSIPPPENPEVSTSPSMEVTNQDTAQAIVAAPMPKIHIAPISNGGLVLKSGGKPTTMRDLDRKMNKSRGRPKRRAMVALYQSEVSLECYFSIYQDIKRVICFSADNSKKAARYAIKNLILQSH